MNEKEKKIAEDLLDYLQVREVGEPFSSAHINNYLVFIEACSKRFDLEVREKKIKQYGV